MSTTLGKHFKGFLRFLNNGQEFKGDEEYRLALLVIGMGITALLMWSYALNVYFTVENIYGLKYLSVVYCFIHFFSVFTYKIFRSINIPMHIFVAAGFCFQFHHTYATGAFYSGTVIWYSILPLIAGVITNRKNIAVWAIIATTGVMLQFYFYINNMHPMAITKIGQYWSQFNISIGYIFLNCILILSYIWLRDKHREEMLEKNNQIRNLVRILGHDINNPLAFMKATMLINSRKYPENNELQNLVSRLDKGIDNIHHIVQNVNELEAIESNKIELEIEKVNLKEVVNDALMIFEAKLKDKNIKVEVKLDDVGEVHVKGQKHTLQNQVINNILSNAIKFSRPDGNILIKGKKNQEYVILEIKDAGVGMPHTLLENIFRSDIKTNRQGTGGERGTGFGMPIVKALMERYDGDIEVESVDFEVDPDNAGTTVILKFSHF
jgi:signal transduction histidine kinase